MRVRHRIPSLFSLSMVDVLCCALGCVILLWLLNAKQHEDDIDERDREAAILQERTRKEREDLDGRIAALSTDRDRAAAHLSAVRADRAQAYLQLAQFEGNIRNLEEDRAKLRKDLSARQVIVIDLTNKLKMTDVRVLALEAKVRAGNQLVATQKAELAKAATNLAGERERADSLSKRLAKAEGGLRDLNRELTAARKGRATEQAQVRDLQQELARRGKDLDSLTRNLEEMRSVARTLRQTLAARDKELERAKGYREKWMSAEARASVLERDVKDRKAELGAAGRSIASLHAEKKRLQGEVARARSANDDRFAGIALTGKRVIFLVDTSGSMEMLTEDQIAPEKWPEVCNTVAQLLRSLPNLEKFQVITFAGTTAYPLGGEGRWLDAGPKSAAEVSKVLRAIKPKGGTNMYTALETAFRYRARGLDTVYLLSDGLPNQGPGLPRNSAGLGEIQRGAILGKYIRNKLHSDWNKRLAGRPRVRINTIGFFYESPDLGSFLWALAREHDGSFVGMSKP
jgi:hypothetical protein